MGDVRYRAVLERVADAENPLLVLREMDDEDVIAALAAATADADPYIVNVLASEAMNRTRRSSRIVETAVEGLVSLDTKGLVTFMNPAAQRLLGWSLDDLRGKCFHDKVHKEAGENGDAAAIPFTECPVFQVMESLRELVGHESTFMRRDGRVIPVTVTAAPILRGGVIEGVVETFTDITARKRAEASLKESENRKRAMLEASPDPIITIDDESRVKEWNPAAERVFGWHAEEILGKDMADHILPYRFRTAHKVGLARYIATGESHILGERIELPAIRRDGTEFPTEITIVPLESAEGELFTGWLRDVTDEKRASEEAREAHAMYQRVLDRVTDAFFALDSEWRFTYLNARCVELAQEMLGKSREDLIGREFWDAIPGMTGSVFEDAYRRAMHDQTATHVEGYYEEADVWFEAHAYPSEEGLSVFFRDVTERRRMADALRESESRYRYLFHSIHEGILVVDLERGIVDCNDAFTEITGYSLGELKGRSTRMLYPSDEAFERVGKEVREGIADGSSVLRTRLVRKDGTEFPADLDLGYYKNAEGAVIGFIGMVYGVDRAGTAETHP